MFSLMPMSTGGQYFTRDNRIHQYISVRIPVKCLLSIIVSWYYNKGRHEVSSAKKRKKQALNKN